MVKSHARTVSEYLQELPVERREAISTVRDIILKHLPLGYQEAINWGMIVYEVPLKCYPKTYNHQPLLYAALASQKNQMAVYLTGIYNDKKTEEWFKERYKVSGKKLSMGKSCVRFTKLEDLPLDLIGDAIARIPVAEFIKIYEMNRPH